MSALVMDEKGSVRMGDNFMSGLRTSAPMKDYISNDNELVDGVDYEKNYLPKQSSREVTLNFVICVDKSSDFQSALNGFYSTLYSGPVELSVPGRSSEIYRLVYKSNVSYAESIDGRMCKVSVKFVEPDPTDRGATSKHDN
jgi:hypothetical protein